MVLGERLGVLLDEVAPLESPDAEPVPTGAWLPPEEVRARRVKLYDFRKPDRFTLRAILALEDIHRHAGEALAQRVTGLEGLKVTLVDQLTWGEWLELDRASGRKLFRSTMGRPSRNYEKETWPARTGAPLLRPSPARHPLSSRLDSHVERWTAEEERLLGEPVLFVAAGGSLAGLQPGDILGALRAGWRQAAGGDLDVVYAARALYSHTKALDRHARCISPR